MRWLLVCIALAGCAARGDDPGEFDEPAVRWPLRRELNRAMEDLSLRGLLDSLPSRLARLPRQSVSLIVADTGARPAEIEPARRALSVIWDRVTAGSDSLRLVLWFYHPITDTSEQSDTHPMTLHLPGAGFAGALMPELTDGRTCVVAIPVPPEWHWSEHRGLAWGVRRVSPCAFRARFGRPGPAMENWLAATGYSAASSLRWLEGRGPFIPPWDYEDIGRGFSGTDWLRPTTLLSIWRASQGDLIPYYAGPAAVRCAAGLLDGCHMAAVGDTAWERSPFRRPPGIAQENGTWYGSLVFRRTEWVSELIRREGDDRFRQWWTSDRDLDHGFEAAYGRSMSASVREFTRIDTELRGERLPIRLGTTMEPMSVAAVAAWLCLFLAWPLVAARRSRG